MKSRYNNYLINEHYIGGRAHNVDVLSALVDRNEKSEKRIKYLM